MKTIYKYPLKLVEEQKLEVPGFLGVVSVIEQGNDIVLYCRVDTGNLKFVERISVRIVGTGQSAEGIEKYQFLGTVKTQHTQYVWHIYVQSQYGIRKD